MYLVATGGGRNAWILLPLLFFLYTEVYCCPYISKYCIIKGIVYTNVLAFFVQYWVGVGFFWYKLKYSFVPLTSLYYCWVTQVLESEIAGYRHGITYRYDNYLTVLYCTVVPDSKVRVSCFKLVKARKVNRHIKLTVMHCIINELYVIGLWFSPTWFSCLYVQYYCTLMKTFPPSTRMWLGLGEFFLSESLWLTWNKTHTPSEPL